MKCQFLCTTFYETTTGTLEKSQLLGEIAVTWTKSRILGEIAVTWTKSRILGQQPSPRTGL